LIGLIGAARVISKCKESGSWNGFKKNKNTNDNSVYLGYADAHYFIADRT